VSDQLLKKAPKSVGQTGLEQLPNECAGSRGRLRGLCRRSAFIRPHTVEQDALSKRQSVLQTADQVIGMFDSDRNADGPLADSSSAASFEGHRGVRHRLRVLDQ